MKYFQIFCISFVLILLPTNVVLSSHFILGSLLDANDHYLSQTLVYLYGDGELSSDLFNEKEIQHMSDVKKLYDLMRYLLLLLVLLVAGLYILKKDNILFLDCLRKSSIIVFGLIIFLAVSFGLFFDQSFVMFHEFFFSNDLWQMDPYTDKMVLVFDNDFFFSLIMFIQVSIAALCMIFIVLTDKRVIRWIAKKKRT